MKETLQIIQVIMAVVLVALVLIQSKGGGLTSGVGSSIGFYRSRRGLEKVVFITTAVISIAIVVNSLALILIN